MTKPQFAELPRRGVIRVSGADAHHFLQNLITADMEEIDKKGAGFGALLTPLPCIHVACDGLLR